MPTGTDFLAITSGHYHSCALRTNGSIVCSGSDNNGQVIPPRPQILCYRIEGVFDLDSLSGFAFFNHRPSSMV